MSSNKFLSQFYLDYFWLQSDICS